MNKLLEKLEIEKNYEEKAVAILKQIPTDYENIVVNQLLYAKELSYVDGFIKSYETVLEQKSEEQTINHIVKAATFLNLPTFNMSAIEGNSELYIKIMNLPHDENFNITADKMLTIENNKLAKEQKTNVKNGLK